MIFKSKLTAVRLIFAISVLGFSNSYVQPKYGRRNHIEKQYAKNGRRHMKLSKDDEQCWLNLNPKKHFDAMDKLDENYAEVRNEYQKAVKKDDFDGQMLKVILQTKGAAEREIHKVDGHAGLIPAGINLGGHCMMRMPNSLLFFHRVKLRNNTHFRVMYLHNDLSNMLLNTSIALNDLHLLGSYDRSITDTDPSVLFYTPTYGEVEFLFQNVQYNMEGRYRLLEDRLTIELIVSKISYDDVMMNYLNEKKSPMKLQRKNIEDFLERLKIDLDKWLKDYFNDYLMYFGIVGTKKNDKFQQYDKERALQHNQYADHVINVIVQKLHKAKAASVKLPIFKIITKNGMQLFLKDGVLRGLDSMYRRSVATGKKEKDVRTLDAVVGFSNMKVTYKYEARTRLNSPPLNGLMIFSADELTARMGVAMVVDSETVDMTFEFLEQAKPESLTVEGPANRVISNFKYIMEQHVITIMSNAIIHNVRSLGSIARCVPLLHGQDDLSPDNEVTKSSMEDLIQQKNTTYNETVTEQSGLVTLASNENNGQMDDNLEQKEQISMNKEASAQDSAKTSQSNSVEENVELETLKPMLKINLLTEEINRNENSKEANNINDLVKKMYISTSLSSWASSSSWSSSSELSSSS